jgi:hypothetical protein
MPFRFLHDLEGLKMVGAGMVAMISVLADMDGANGLESITLKVALLLAIVYLWRELQKQREAAMNEGGKREETLEQVIAANTAAKEENTKALHDLKAATDLQTSYYKTVAHTLLSREITPKLPP